MRSRLKMFKSGDGTGFLYFHFTDTPQNPIAGGQTVFLPSGDPGTGDSTQVNILPTPITNIVKPPAASGPAPIDSYLEQDYYAMSCPDLANLIAYIQNLIMSARLTQVGGGYYSNKLNQAQTAYSAKCGGTPPSTPTVDPSSPPISILPDTGTINPKPGSATTINIGDVSALNPALASGAGGSGSGLGGGGGGGSSTTPAAAKKTNWWLWALALGAFGLALYKGK